MGLFQKSIDDITEADLEALIPNVLEGQRLDYKREYERKDGATWDILADVSAMANVAGGYLIVGMHEDDSAEDGTPGELVGVDNASELQRRIESVCHTNIDPPIIGVRVVNMLLKSGKGAVIVHVPSSVGRPHMITHRGKRAFYSRHERQNLLMGTQEIRRAVLTSYDAEARMQKHLDDREMELVDAVNRMTGPALSGIERVAGGLRSNISLLWMYAVPQFVDKDRINVIATEPNCFLQQPPQQRSKYGPTGSVHARVAPTLHGIERSDHKWLFRMHRPGFLDLSYWDVSFERDGVRILKTMDIAGWAYWWSFVACKFSERFLDGETLVMGLTLFNVDETTIWARHDAANPVPQLELQHATRIDIPPIPLTAEDDYRVAAKRLVDRLFNAYGVHESGCFMDDGRLLTNEYLADRRRDLPESASIAWEGHAPAP